MQHTWKSKGMYEKKQCPGTHWPNWISWKSNGKNGQLHTPTTHKSNALQLINGIKSILTTSQNQCTPIGRSMEIMPMHTTHAPIYNLQLKDNYIHHLPASTNNMEKNNGPIMQRHATQYEIKKIWDFSKKTPKFIKMRHLRWGVLLWLWHKINLKIKYFSLKNAVVREYTIFFLKSLLVLILRISNFNNLKTYACAYKCCWNKTGNVHLASSCIGLCKCISWCDQ